MAAVFIAAAGCVLWPIYQELAADRTFFSGWLIPERKGALGVLVAAIKKLTALTAPRHYIANRADWALNI